MSTASYLPVENIDFPEAKTPPLTEEQNRLAGVGNTPNNGAAQYGRVAGDVDERHRGRRRDEGQAQADRDRADR